MEDDGENDQDIGSDSNGVSDSNGENDMKLGNDTN